MAKLRLKIVVCGGKDNMPRTFENMKREGRNVLISFRTPLYNMGTRFVETKLIGTWPEDHTFLVNGPAVPFVYSALDNDVLVKETDGSAFKL